MMVSIIIPTSGRIENLQRTLVCLNRQSIDHDQFEVLVIVDGEAQIDQNLDIKDIDYSIALLHQPKQGATQARNLGAMRSSGEILVFLDDDICLSSGGLQALYQAIEQAPPKTILLGALVLPEEILQISLFARVNYEPLPRLDQEVHYTYCKTGLLSVTRTDFFALGLFQDPTGGWPNWDDVDFGYRAHLQGYRFMLCAQAIGEHWDHASLNMQVASQRSFQAGKSAVRLFQVHPELLADIPMFRDMLKSKFTRPSLRLELRMLARKITSLPLLIHCLELSALVIEKMPHRSENPSGPTAQNNGASIQPLFSRVLRKLYIWVLGGYTYQGVRSGLYQYGPLV